MRSKTRSVFVIISLKLQLREKKKCQRGRWNLWKSKQNRHAKRLSIWLFLIWSLAIRTSYLTPFNLLYTYMYFFFLITVNDWVLFYIILVRELYNITSYVDWYAFFNLIQWINCFKHFVIICMQISKAIWIFFFFFSKSRKDNQVYFNFKASTLFHHYKP